MKKTKEKKSNNADHSLCSGYRVFPNGDKCKGCIDCDFGKDKRTVRQVFSDTHIIGTTDHVHNFLKENLS